MRLRTVALIARNPGYLVLRDALIGNPALELAAVFTHGRLPNAEGGGPRDDVEKFRQLCNEADVPLHVVERQAAREICAQLPPDLDLLIALSWRYLVPQEALDKFRHGCINVHRGSLPDYAGAKPVERAIAGGERRVAITAHEMIAELDAGEKVAEVWLDIGPFAAPVDAAAMAEEVKATLEALYAPLVRLAVLSRLQRATV